MMTPQPISSTDLLLQRSWTKINVVNKHVKNLHLSKDDVVKMTDKV